MHEPNCFKRVLSWLRIHRLGPDVGNNHIMSVVTSTEIEYLIDGIDASTPKCLDGRNSLGSITVSGLFGPACNSTSHISKRFRQIRGALEAHPQQQMGICQRDSKWRKRQSFASVSRLVALAGHRTSLPL